MSSLRAALGIRNSHNPLRNLVYTAWERYARLKSTVASASQYAQFVSLLKSAGIDDEGFTDVPLVNGLAQLPRPHNPIVVPYLFRILHEYRGAIEESYGSHFRVNWFEVQRIAPGQRPAGSSCAYHTDDTPHAVLKLFVYLNDTYESNGAFRCSGVACSLRSHRASRERRRRSWCRPISSKSSGSWRGQRHGVRVR